MITLLLTDVEREAVRTVVMERVVEGFVEEYFEAALQVTPEQAERLAAALQSASEKL